MLRGIRLLVLVAILPVYSHGSPEYFTPKHRIAGIGLARHDITPEVLAARSEAMIQAQTFAILRDPQALEGAKRITEMHPLFEKAASAAGIPTSLLSAIAYLESWGDPNATSPAACKGIMQFAQATAREAGLQILYATHYKTTVARRAVKNKDGKLVYRDVKVNTPYTVTVRDERLMPELAVPATANYLRRLTGAFGSLDWAVFAYHCGEGCVTQMQALTREAVGGHVLPTVPQMFFTASPAYHRELYDAIQFHMTRDFSPTYWFRIKRAEQLLLLYQEEPDSFRALRAEYRNPYNPEKRVNDRLSLWLRAADVVYQNGDDLRSAQGKTLVPVPDDARFFGFTLAGLKMNGGSRDLYQQASPPAVGTLGYISFETRRLFDAMKPARDKWTPLVVVELVNTKDGLRDAGVYAPEIPAHGTGQVFDIDMAGLPRSEREALWFVINELGWDGYLGYVELSGTSVHLGCAPSAREFFTGVFQDM
jgi:Transglycosylase SLT domain